MDIQNSAPVSAGNDPMGIVMVAMREFTAAQGKGPAAAPAARDALQAAMEGYARATADSAVYGTDYRVITAEVEDPQRGKGVKVMTEDLTPIGQGFLVRWGGFLGWLEEQADRARLAQLETVVAALAQKVGSLDAAVNNALIDLKRIAHKVRV